MKYGSKISSNAEAKECVLHYKKIKQFKDYALLEIIIETGRKHQIRVQLSQQGFPILGDKRYGSKIALKTKAISLHARKLGFKHPTLDKVILVEAELPSFWSDYLP